MSDPTPEPPLVLRIDPAPPAPVVRRGLSLRRRTLTYLDLGSLTLTVVAYHTLGYLIIWLGLGPPRGEGIVLVVGFGALLFLHLICDPLFAPLGEAVAWCLVFLAVQILGALTAAGVVLTAFALRTAEPGKFYLDQLEGLGRAAARTGPNEPPRPPLPDEIGQALAYGMLAAQVASVVLIALVVPRRIGPDWKRQIGVRTPAGLHVLLVILVVPGFMLLSDGIQELFLRLTRITQPAANEALNGTFRTVPGFVTFLAVALGPGLVEELWCRGFLGRKLCARYGLAAGVFLTSLLFGLLHIDPSHVFIAGLMGAYLHFVFLAARSIWVPVLLHLLNNGLAVLIVLNPDLRAAGERYKLDEQGMRAVMDIAALGLLVFASVGLWTSRAEVIRTKPRGGEAVAGWEPEYPGISAPPAGVPAKLGYGAVSPAAMMLALASFGVLAYLLSRV